MAGRWWISAVGRCRVKYSTGIVEEHLATRKFGGLFDVSHMGRFRIKGSDRIAFMQHVLTNNCLALEPWQSQYTMIQNQNGGAIDDAFLYRFGEGDYLLVVNAANRDKDWGHFQTQAQTFSDVVIEDHTDSLALIAFQGPLVKGVLEQLAEGGLLPEPKQNRLSEITLCGTKILLSRTGYTGEPNSFELFVPAEKVEEVWDTLYRAGWGAGNSAGGPGRPGHPEAGGLHASVRPRTGSGFPGQGHPHLRRGPGRAGGQLFPAEERFHRPGGPDRAVRRLGCHPPGSSQAARRPAQAHHSFGNPGPGHRPSGLRGVY